MTGHIYKFKYKSEFLSFLDFGHFKELKSFKKLILLLFIYLSITITIIIIIIIIYHHHHHIIIIILRF